MQEHMVIAANLRRLGTIYQWIKHELNAAADAIERLDRQERDEVSHWREAAASVGEQDGHGWAETTKSLRAELSQCQSDRQREHDLRVRFQGECETLRAQLPED